MLIPKSRRAIRRLVLGSIALMIGSEILFRIEERPKVFVCNLQQALGSGREVTRIKDLFGKLPGMLSSSTRVRFNIS